MTKTRRLFAAIAVILMAAWCVPAAPALAFGHHKTTVHHSFVHRHSTAASLAGGYAAYKAAKITARNRKAHGRRLNFAQRHPIMTGIAGAALTHHMIKHHTR